MVSPTIPLSLWTALTPSVSAQLSSILSSLSLTPVPSSLVTEITPESSSFASLSVSHNASTTAIQSSTTKDVIGITGVAPTASGNATTTTATAARPRPTQNTTPCNGYPEFCSRRLSNISMVVAHNSPFVVPHNAASNQVLGVVTQLNDGIRGCTCQRLSSSIHSANKTLQCNSRHRNQTPRAQSASATHPATYSTSAHWSHTSQPSASGSKKTPTK